MTLVEQRIIHLEQLLRVQSVTNANVAAQLAALQQAVRTTQQGSYGGTSSTAQPVYFTTNSSSVGPATISGGTTPPDITPATFTASVWCNVGGSMTLFASSQTIYWWYLDTCPANSLIPVEPSNGGTTWDAIAAGCTAL